jgi:hypothetical protein
MDRNGTSAAQQLTPFLQNPGDWGFASEKEMSDERDHAG